MLTGGAVGHSTLFTFLKDHWQFVKLRFGNRKHLWNGIVNAAASSFNTQEGYDLVSELYETRKGESETDDGVLENAMKNIGKASEWNQQHLPVIESWLDCHLSAEDLAKIEGNTTSVTVTTVTPPTTGSSSTIVPIAG